MPWNFLLGFQCSGGFTLVRQMANSLQPNVAHFMIKDKPPRTGLHLFLPQWNMCGFLFFHYYINTSSLQNAWGIIEVKSSIWRQWKEFSYCFFFVKTYLISCSVVSDSFVTPWRLPLLSLKFSRKEHWSGLPFPPLGDLPDPGIEPTPPASPASQADSLPLSHLGSP